MKVRFFEKAKGLVRLGLGGMALMLFASSAHAAPGWVAELIDISGQTIDNQTEAQSLWSPAPNLGGPYSVDADATDTYGEIDFAGGAGTFSVNNPYPTGVTNESQEDFAIRATTAVKIPAGTWSVAFGTDDGGAIQIPGVTFSSRFGTNGSQADNEIRYEGNRGHSWTGGTFTVPAGGLNTFVTAFMHERGGGDDFEVAAFKGTDTTVADGTWSLLSDGFEGWKLTAATPPVVPQTVPVAGLNTVDTQTLNIASSNITVTPAAGPTVPGLAEQWYPVTVGDSAGADALAASTKIFQGTIPANSPWWAGTDGTAGQATSYPAYPADIVAGKMFPGAKGGNQETYTVVLTGEIKIPENGTYNFKDGVDDYTLLRIDGQELINDNSWTSLDGHDNGGSPIASYTASGIPAGGKWVSFQMVTSEGGGGDAGYLAWDYDASKPAGQRLNGNSAFPTAQDAPVTDLHKAAVPQDNLRTNGLPTLSGTQTVKLFDQATYVFDFLSTTRHDTLAAPAAPAATIKTVMDLNSDTLQIGETGSVKNGDTVKILNADQFTGNFTFVAPAGQVWDTSKLLTTGEIKAVSGVGGTAPGKTGDLDGDGDVDTVDLNKLLGNWTGALAGNADPSKHTVVYNPTTGDLDIVPNADGIVGFVFEPASGKALKPQADADFKAATPWSEGKKGWSNSANQIGSADTVDIENHTDSIHLAGILPTGLNADGFKAFFKTFSVTTLGKDSGINDVNISIVPEPGSLALMGLGVLGLVNVVRRRRSA